MFEHDDDDPALRRLAAEERAVLDATELICDVLEREEVTRAELARRLHVGPAEITHRLRGRNLTVKSLAATLDALDHDLVLSTTPRVAPRMTRVTWFDLAIQSLPVTPRTSYDAPRVHSSLGTFGHQVAV